MYRASLEIPASRANMPLNLKLRIERDWQYIFIGVQDDLLIFTRLGSRRFAMRRGRYWIAKISGVRSVGTNRGEMALETGLARHIRPLADSP
jgi:hypothetical protein